MNLESILYWGLIVIVFLVILTILVLIHELGHYLTAKKFGIKVEEFGFGFPPRVFGKKRGETIYSINALPIGGFVKLYGEDDAGSGKISKGKKVTKDLDRAFFSRPIWQRIVVVTAGVAMNFLLAVLIATYLLTFQGLPKDGQSVIVTEVSESSPAATAGLKTGDEITEVNSKRVVKTQDLIDQTKTRLGEEVTLTVKRGEETFPVKLTPRENPPEGQGSMGVAIEHNVIIQKYPFPQSIYYGTKQAGSDSILVVTSFVDMIKTIATRQTVPEGVAGPVGMYRITGEIVKVGPEAIIPLMYMLTLSLAVLNILPIPALDGGRLLFILIEAVTRKKVNAKYEAYVHMVGMAVLILFIIFVTYKDIINWISGRPIIPQ
jgi:regulator of sigma E protease